MKALPLLASVLVMVIISCGLSTKFEDKAAERISSNGSLENVLSQVSIPVNYKVVHIFGLSSAGASHGWDVEYKISQERFVSCNGSSISGGGGNSSRKSVIRPESCVVGGKLESSVANFAMTITDVISELRSSNTSSVKLLVLDDRQCHYNIWRKSIWGKKYSRMLVCFNENGSLVNYVRDNYDIDRSISYWQINGYEFTQEQIELVNKKNWLRE